LRGSQLFLLVLSPEYLKSPYCEWEVVEYLKYESARAVLGEGMAPIYFVTIHDLDEPGFDLFIARLHGMRPSGIRLQ
jgi:hypothetical protein